MAARMEAEANRRLAPTSSGDGAEAQAADEKSLYRIEQHSERNNKDAACSGHFAPFNPTIRNKRSNGDRQSLSRATRKNHRKQELTPAEDERENRGRDYSRGSDWNHDPTKGPENCGPIQRRRLIELDRNLFEKADHGPDDVRQIERGIDDNQTDSGIEHP